MKSGNTLHGYNPTVLDNPVMIALEVREWAAIRKVLDRVGSDFMYTPLESHAMESLAKTIDLVCREAWLPHTN